MDALAVDADGHIISNLVPLSDIRLSLARPPTKYHVR